jgi:carbon storage regulator
MLVLSRQRDETIMIGDNIEITIVDIRGDKVRLGISAPKTIPVHRKEVWESIQRENRDAAQRSAQIDLQQVTQPPPETPAPPAHQGQRPPVKSPDRKADANHP